VGFLPPDDPRVVGTVEAIQRHLSDRGFVSRYATRAHVDGLPPGEATFLPCSFWMVDNLVLQGRRDEAVQMYQRLLAVSTDLGLFAEEYDPSARRLVGNFPQAFTHVGVINSARNLTQAQCPAEHRRKK
jgi:GH15 family glucan-1,4-alpha-glucosidase